MELRNACLQCLAIFIMAQTVVAEFLLHSFRGKIGAGNFTYYKMTKEGNIKLVLTSLSGDADLYISDEVLTPDYENYERCAATCGQDVVEIDHDLRRPVGIGVYGHVFHEVSHFQLDVYVEGVNQYGTRFSSLGSSPGSNSEDGEEESLFLSVIVGLLKIIIDILV